MIDLALVVAYAIGFVVTFFLYIRWEKQRVKRGESFGCNMEDLCAILLISVYWPAVIPFALVMVGASRLLNYINNKED